MKIKNITIVLPMIVFAAGTAHTKIGLPSIKRVREKVEKALETARTISSLTQEKIGQFAKPDIAAQVLSEISKTLDNLYWSKQAALLIALEDLKNDTPYGANQLLSEKIKERYTGERAAFVQFTQALVDEERQLQDVVKKLVSLDVRYRVANESAIKELATQQGQLIETLYKFINLVNELLLI